MMQRDIRQTALYREAEQLYEAFRQPGAGRISDASELHAAPDGRHAVFAATIVGALEGAPTTRICKIDLLSGHTRILTSGPNTDRLPKYSPAGEHVAFLSDRRGAGDFQLYLLDPISGVVRDTPSVEGWVEYFHWSPDGKRILLGVAGHGADVSGPQGAVTSRQAEAASSWMPAIETGEEHYRWRSAWLYDLTLNQVRAIAHAGPAINVWEAVWCGNEAVAAVVSAGPHEGHWYEARLCVMDVQTGQSHELYSPDDQLGCPAASPSGRHLAVVEALCSDRGVVAGDLWLIDTASGEIRKVDTSDVDVSYAEWRSDRHLLVAGHRGFATVVALYDTSAESYTEIWSSADITAVGRYVTVSGLPESGGCALLAETFTRAPEVAVILDGEYRTVRSFDLDYGKQAKVIQVVERICWRAPDGLDIQGWLLRPKGEGPHPLVMHLHGGPVWHWRPVCLARGALSVLMLLSRGYAVFFPNPRGSSGRGQSFARYVLGDMGGTDTYDCLSGLDHLVERGIADPKRLGVTGRSYGGFMTAWLITQDSRFAAAVPVAAATNHVSEHLVSNIPHFTALFLADTYTNPGGKYFQRSPIMHAHKARTPTLSICGALDRCTPAEESMQFHNALLKNGVRTMLVTYPEEGHGVRKWPAAIDYAARIVSWFVEHMPATAAD